jgi:hypothetical protein
MLLSADEEALAALQEQVASSLPQLASGTDPLTGSRGELDPRQQLRSAAKADSVLAGLVAALQDQVRGAPEGPARPMQAALLCKLPHDRCGSGAP